MNARNLESIIIATAALFDYTTNHLLTTEWIDGLWVYEASKRTSDIGDVPCLYSIALKDYLGMILETGTLHCDPSSGWNTGPDRRYCNSGANHGSKYCPGIPCLILGFIPNNIEAPPPAMITSPVAGTMAPMLIPQVRPSHKYPIYPWETIHLPGGDNAVGR
jgi:hypothetical protein